MQNLKTLILNSKDNDYKNFNAINYEIESLCSRYEPLNQEEQEYLNFLFEQRLEMLMNFNNKTAII